MHRGQYSNLSEPELSLGLRRQACCALRAIAAADDELELTSRTGEDGELQIHPGLHGTPRHLQDEVARPNPRALGR